MSVILKHTRYKDSGFEWLGEVPEHWDVQSLRAVARLYVEKNQPDLPVLSVYREYGVILKDSRDDNHNATSLDTSNYKVVRPGDLAVNKMKAWQGSLGVSEHHGIVSPAYITCRLNQEKVTGRYIHYLLRSKTLVGALDSISYGVRVGQWDMRFEDFKKVGITIPLKSEQDRIVAFLDQKTVEIDALIAKKQRQIELLNEQKAILIHRAVTRSLKPNAKLKPSGIEWIGDIPEHWETRRARHIFRQEERPIRKTDDVVTAFRDGQVTLRSKRRTEGFTFAILEQGYQGIEPGDLVIHGMDAFAGAIGISEDRGKCTPEYIILNSIIEGIDNGFFALHLREMAQSGYIHLICPSVRERAPRFRFPKLADVLLTIPPLDEQLEIVSLVRKIREESARVVASLTAQIGGFKNLRSTLIAHAVTGGIKV
jgi:type I restriction enzyme S subunit